MRTKLLYILSLLMLPLSAWADGVEIGGIHYILDEETKTASVTYTGESFESNYAGDIVIPASVTYDKKPYAVTSIGQYAFYNCDYMTSVSIPNSVTSIEACAFDGCSGLTSVTIPNSVTDIKSWAFSRCTNLVSITIPNSVERIGSRTFENCWSLTSINIPASVESIDDWTFMDCHSLESITVDAGNTVYDSRESCNAIIETENNKLIAGCKNSFIPNTVTWIYEAAFYACDGLTSITIPNSVATIGPVAFHGCDGLTSIYIPASVTGIGDYAFSDCANLASITVDAENIVYDSREGCNAIIETASNKLITGCKNSFIPNTVTTIGYNAFSNCRGLESITIPNSVTTIEEWAFNGCYEMTSINLPNSLTTIENSAFWGCDGVTTLVIPASVESIGDYAFYFCTALKDIYALRTSPLDYNTGEDIFGGFDTSTCNLHVISGCAEIYSVYTEWNKFNIVDDIPTGITDAQLSTFNSQLIYDLQGRRVRNAQKGIYIQDGKKLMR